MRSILFRRIVRPFSSERILPKLTLVEHPFSLTSVPLDPQAPSKDQFAVIELLGKQHKVMKGDTIVVDNISTVDIGQSISIDKVLLAGSRKSTLIGRPYITGANVNLLVEEKTKDKKVLIYKSRRRKNSKSLNGFRRDILVLRVDDISVPNDSL